MPEPYVRTIRRKWKPTKERLVGNPKHEPLLIRFHRACSWMAQAEAAHDQDTDERLLFSWIALNSLYGRWDEQRNEPEPDGRSMPAFIDAICEMDSKGRFGEMLQECRDLAMEIFEDPYVTEFFWKAPSAGRARQATGTRHHAKTWYAEQKWRMILQHLVDRIYFLRCQIVHGAATYRGKVNRKALARCADMLEAIVWCALDVICERGTEWNWGRLCYPPRGGQSGAQF